MSQIGLNSTNLDLKLTWFFHLKYELYAALFVSRKRRYFAKSNGELKSNASIKADFGI